MSIRTAPRLETAPIDDALSELEQLFARIPVLMRQILATSTEQKTGQVQAAYSDDYPLKRKVAAQLLGVADLTLKRWIDKGEVAAMGEGKRQYVTYGEIKRFIGARQR